MFGYAFSEAVGQPLALLMPEPDKSRQAEYLANYLAGQSPKIIGTSRGVLGLRKDGTTVPLELSVNDVVLAGRRLFIGLLREMPKRAAKAAGGLNVEKTAIIRVHARLLDSLFNLAGELVITKNRIDTLVAGRPNKDLKAALATMDRLVNELQEDISAARLVAVDEVFQKFPRLVCDFGARGEQGDRPGPRRPANRTRQIGAGRDQRPDPAPSCAIPSTMASNRPRNGTRPINRGGNDPAGGQADREPYSDRGRGRRSGHRRRASESDRGRQGADHCRAGRSALTKGRRSA